MIERWASWTTRLALIGSLGIALAGCGEQPPAASDTDQDADEVVLASPAGSPFPEARVVGVEPIEVSLENGQLSPDRVEGIVGDSIELLVDGDGSEHTLSIEGLVDNATIAAEGQTSVQFTISGDAREVPILIDGEQAGTFAAQLAGGITDQ